MCISGGEDHFPLVEYIPVYIVGAGSTFNRLDPQACHIPILTPNRDEIWAHQVVSMNI